MFDLFFELERLKRIAWTERGRIKSLVIESRDEGYQLVMTTTNNTRVYWGRYGGHSTPAYLMEELHRYLWEHHGQYVEKEGRTWPLPH